MTLIERMPPHSIEAEEAVLGSILIDPEALDRVSDVLRAEDFYLIKNQWVWDACQHLHQHRLPIDAVTLRRELEAQQRLDELGGPVYLTQLMTSVPTAIHAEGYGRIVVALAERRRLLTAASTIAQLAYDESADNEAVTDQAERAGVKRTPHSIGSHHQVVRSPAPILRPDRIPLRASRRTARRADGLRRSRSHDGRPAALRHDRRRRAARSGQDLAGCSTSP